ncbi:34541_t:CDS:2, partial [Racocetra persica]
LVFGLDIFRVILGCCGICVVLLEFWEEEDGKIRYQESNNNSNNENGKEKENSSSDSDNHDESLQDDMRANEINENVSKFISIQNLSNNNDIT